MATLNAHDYTVGEILTAATMDGVTADLNAINTDLASSCYIETGTYAGNNSTGRAITLTDTALVIKSLAVYPTGADAADVIWTWTDNLLVDDDADGLVVRHSADGVEHQLRDFHVLSVGTGTFSVDLALNANGTTYNYTALGTH